MYVHIYSACYIPLDETKKDQRGNIIRIANVHKKYKRQDRDPAWLGHIAAR